MSILSITGACLGVAMPPKNVVAPEMYAKFKNGFFFAAFATGVPQNITSEG